jgi:small redox-active disulfide protein 2
MTEIKILGPGCANCHTMEKLAQAAVGQLGIDAKVEKVSEIQEIMKYTMSTPGLVVNGKLKHSGKPLPTVEKIKEMIKAEV